MRPLLTFARVVSVSAPFDAGNTVEVKLTLDRLHVDGEIYLRVPAATAARFTAGDIYAVHLEPSP